MHTGGFYMRFLSIALVLAAGVCRAGDLNIHVMLSGEVAPGVYGQVQLGNERPPPLVYAQPMLIEPQAAPPPPVYLHVPPGHARNWRKHCREYNACNRPVYFVRSQEYEPAYRRGDRDYRRGDRDYERDRSRHDEGDHDQRDRSRHDEGDHDHEHHGHDRHDDK
jgi:hypothetical protein